MILVDASVLIDYLSGREGRPAERFQEVLDQEVPFGLSPLTFLEVLQGAAAEKDFKKLREYLGSQTIYDVREGTASYARAARLYFDLRRKGVTVGSTLDCLIAVTAMEHDLYLFHNDADFDRIAKAAPLKIW